jgi:hypothetical protein
LVFVIFLHTFPLSSSGSPLMDKALKCQI